MHRSSRKGGTVFPFLPVIALIAFGIRFAVSCQLIAADPAVYAPSIITDMRTYMDIADQILKGSLPETFYYQPFYYAVFLPLCRLLTPSPYVLALVQSLLGAATVYLAGRSAQLICGRRSGWWSGLLCCFCAIHIYFTPYALLELLQGFWIVLLFYLALRLPRRSTWIHWGIWGFILGCSILTRGNTWCFLPLPVLYVLLMRGRAEWRKTLLNSLVMLMCVQLPQLPFALYNTVQQKHLSGPSTAGGAVLAIGNNPEGAPAGLELPYPRTYELWMSTEKEISIPRRMFDWLKAEPAAFLEQQFQKLFLFWDSMDYPNNISEYNAAKSSLMRTLHFLPTGFIVLLGLAGLLSLRHFAGRRRGFVLLAAFILLYSLSIIAFYILARFRLPVLPLLCVSGGVWLERFIRSRGAVRIQLFGWGALACFIVYGFAPLYASAYEPVILAAVRPDGVQTEFNEPSYPWKNAPEQRHFLQVSDHSSALKGGWIPLENGNELEKIFRIRKPLAAERALLVLAAPGTGGSAILTVNGSRQLVSVQDNRILAEIPVQEENGCIRVNLKIEESRGNWVLAADLLRNYGRTGINGKTVPFELSAWLVVPVRP